MSIASRITQIEEHIGDIYDTLELGGDSTQNKNIVNINSEIKREYKDFLANGTDTLWNNWNKVSGTGESLTLNNTIKAKMEIEYGGNTSQEGTPSPDSPQDIHIVSGDNTLTIGDGTNSTTYPINLPNGMYLGKIGDYKDRIYYDNGKWYLEKKIGNYQLSSSSVVNISYNYNNIKYYGFAKQQDDIAYNNNNVNNVIYSNAISQSSYINNFDNASYIGMIFSQATKTNYWVGFNLNTTLEQAQSLLNDSEICYRLSTPTITEITDTTLLSQLEAIKYSYDNQTSISQINTDLPFELSVSALGELE